MKSNKDASDISAVPQFEINNPIAPAGLKVGRKSSFYRNRCSVRSNTVYIHKIG